MPKTPEIDNAQTEEAIDSKQTSMARRRLLRLGAYVTPAIVGMAIIGSMPGTAFARKPGSCRPSACKPCIDYGKSDDKYSNKSKNDYSQCYGSQRQWDYQHSDKSDD